MKKLLYILFSFLPVVVSAQFNLYKDSPLDYAWKNVGNAGFSAGWALYTSLAFSPSGQPYVAYFDDGNSQKTTVMKFDGTNWINVGNAGFSSGEAQFQSLVFSPIDGQPYVAFWDGGNSSKATLMKFDGSNWVNVGNAGFSAGEATWESLAFSPSGQPYVAYTDYANSLKATVMTFNGTNWVNVGNVGFSAVEAECESLAFSPSGEPYVAFADDSTIPWGKATVMKFDGTNWINVGNAGFSAGNTWGESLAFSPSGQPYVAYIDYPDSQKTSVMKFDGTNWVYVGVEGFSASCGWINSEGLAFSPTDGQPYVAYEDSTNSYKATVMKFDGTNWVNVGNAGFSSGFSQCESLAFSPSGEPYVAYEDGFDGKATVMKYDSVMVGINRQKESRFSLYPNPAKDKITIETSPIPTQSQLFIMNLNGQALITRQITEPKTHVDISMLPSGVYFVRVTNDRTVEVGKIIKQ